MRSVILLFLLCISLACNNTLANAPDVDKDVHVLKNATAEQCQSTMDGQTDQVDVQGYSGAGEFTDTSGPGVRSCTGCAIDSASGDCVCKLCYNYFN